MTNKEAIEILSRPFDMKKVPQDILEAHRMAISALEKQKGKKPIAVETNIYDQEEIHHGCTVQILSNSVTGDVSVGWWEEKEGEE